MTSKDQLELAIRAAKIAQTILQLLDVKSQSVAVMMFGDANQQMSDLAIAINKIGIQK